MHEVSLQNWIQVTFTRHDFFWQRGYLKTEQKFNIQFCDVAVKSWEMSHLSLKKLN